MLIVDSKILSWEDEQKSYLTWAGFEYVIDELIMDYKLKERKCVAVYGPPRGGLPIAVTLSHRLNIPMIEKLSDRPTIGDVLVVDDIADTGKTLEPYVGKQTVVYTLHYHKQSTVIPDKWVFEKLDKWIIYPWENMNEKQI